MTARLRSLELNDPRLEAEEFQQCRLEVDFPSVIPAQAGIEVSYAVVRISRGQRLDAGLRGHDELSLRLKHALSLACPEPGRRIEGARDFNYPRETNQMAALNAVYFFVQNAQRVCPAPDRQPA